MKINEAENNNEVKDTNMTLTRNTTASQIQEDLSTQHINKTQPKQTVICNVTTKALTVY